MNGRDDWARHSQPSIDGVTTPPIGNGHGSTKSATWGLRLLVTELDEDWLELMDTFVLAEELSECRTAERGSDMSTVWLDRNTPQGSVFRFAVRRA